MALTLEELTLWVAAAAQPLEKRLTDGDIEAFFSEIAVPAPEVIANAPGVVTASARVAASVGQLTPRIPELAEALRDRDVQSIGRLVDLTAPAVRELVRHVRDLADAVDVAATDAGPNGPAVRAFAAQLPERLFGYLLSAHLEEIAPPAHDLAVLLGLVELTEVPQAGAVPAHQRRILRFDRIGRLLRDPSGLMAEVYGWGTPSFDWDRFSTHLFHVLAATGYVSLEDDPAGGPPRLRVTLVDIGPTDEPVPGLRATVRDRIAPGLNSSVPLSSAVTWEAVSDGEIEAETALELLPEAQVRVAPPNVPLAGRLSTALIVADASGGTTVLLGTSTGARLEARSVRAAAEANLRWDLADGAATAELVLAAELKNGRVVIDLAESDGFLRSLLPADGLAFGFDVRLAWSNARGLYFEGAAGLEIDLPVDLELGPVRIPAIRIRLASEPSGVSIAVLAGAGAVLGPFTVLIDRLGVEAVLAVPHEEGNLGVADLGMRFRPPSGVGFSLDAGIVRGGGFLDIDETGTEYAGVLELTFGPVSVKAIGILSTEVPGEGGWALLVLVFSEFSAVQLGYGFTLNALGGVIGLQHGISTHAVQAGLRTGVLDSVLFPVNPVANAPQLLSQLRVVFPITPRALIVGPVLKIGWSTPPLITISLGLVLQFDDVLGAAGPPQLTRVVLLGQLKVRVPPDVGQGPPAVLKLVVDIVGRYELREKALAMDAPLRDSHIAGLPLTGSLVARARFGAQPAFILAVGGFHPRFTDLPPGLPPQDGVGFQLAYDIVTVRVVGYTAVTSNTFQIGAEAFLLAAAAGFRVEALLGFDALFVFTPRFQFVSDFRVGASIRYRSRSLASVDVRGLLSGPGRWVVTGHASFKVLLWRVSIDFEVAWGDQPPAAIPSLAVQPLLVAALEDPSNWLTQLPAAGNALVTLRQPAIDGVLAHPLGELSVIQRVVPLGVDIDRVGTARPSDGRRFDIAAVEIGTPGTPGFRSAQPTYREEHFARGEYLDLTEEQKLSAASFERFRAGVALSSDTYVAGGGQVSYDPDIETLYLDEPDERDVGRIDADLMTRFAHYGAASYSELRTGEKLAADRALVATVADPAFTVADAGGLTAHAAEVFTSQTLASQASSAAPARSLAIELAEVLAAP